MCSDVAPALVCMALHYRRFVSASRVIPSLLDHTMGVKAGERKEPELILIVHLLVFLRDEGSESVCFFFFSAA